MRHTQVLSCGLELAFKGDGISIPSWEYNLSALEVDILLPPDVAFSVFFEDELFDLLASLEHEIVLEGNLYVGLVVGIDVESLIGRQGGNYVGHLYCSNNFMLELPDIWVSENDKTFMRIHC